MALARGATSARATDATGRRDSRARVGRGWDTGRARERVRARASGAGGGESARARVERTQDRVARDGGRGAVDARRGGGAADAAVRGRTRARGLGD